MDENLDVEEMPEMSYDISKSYPCSTHWVAHMVGDYHMIGHGDTEAEARGNWRQQWREANSPREDPHSVWVLRIPGEDLWVRQRVNSLTGKLQAHLTPWESPEGLPTFFASLDAETILIAERLSGASLLQAIPFLQVRIPDKG